MSLDVTLDINPSLNFYWFSKYRLSPDFRASTGKPWQPFSDLICPSSCPHWVLHTQTESGLYSVHTAPPPLLYFKGP